MTTTSFENILVLLQEKDMVPDSPEDHTFPIALHCQQHQHHFRWDMKFIQRRLRDDFLRRYDTLCPTCIDAIIIHREAEEICRNVNVDFIRVSPTDKNVYHYRHPHCGHESSLHKKHLRTMGHPPFCTTCFDERKSRQDPKEYPLLEKFHSKLRRLRKKQTNFLEKIPDMLEHIYKRLVYMNIGMHQIGFDEEQNDVWIYMKCEGENYCHRNIIMMDDMLYRLKDVNQGRKTSVCPECCHS